jgi:hypothetical protein
VRWFILLLFAVPAYAAPPPDVHPASPRHAWFENQYSVSGAWCCNVSDGHILDDTEWRQGAAGYEVRINKAWKPVPSDAMRDPKGGPNETGKAVVWYTSGLDGPRIYCFCPGTLY